MSENLDKSTVRRYKETEKVLAKYGLGLKKSKQKRKILNEPDSEKLPEEKSPKNLENPTKKAEKTPQNAQSETPASRKGHRMIFDKPSPKNPVIRAVSEIRQKKILDLTPETPKQKRSSKSAAKNLFSEARAKRCESIFDPETESESPVIKFAGSRRAFNTTTQTIEKTYIKSPGRKSIGNGRAEMIMSLVEDSFDATITKKNKKSINKQEEKILKKKCLTDNLTVKINPIDHLLEVEKLNLMETETATPVESIPVAQSTLSKTKIAKFQPLNESTISGEDTRKTFNNTSLRSGDEIPLDFSTMSSKQKWNWILTIPREELKNQDWDAFHNCDFTDFDPGEAIQEYGEILFIDDTEEQLYRKFLFKHKMTIVQARN